MPKQQPLALWTYFELRPRGLCGRCQALPRLPDCARPSRLRCTVRRRPALTKPGWMVCVHFVYWPLFESFLLLLRTKRFPTSPHFRSTLTFLPVASLSKFLCLTNCAASAFVLPLISSIHQIFNLMQRNRVSYLVSSLLSHWNSCILFSF